jgi:hypothetical protein
LHGLGKVGDGDLEPSKIGSSESSKTFVDPSLMLLSSHAVHLAEALYPIKTVAANITANKANHILALISLT